MLHPWLATDKIWKDSEFTDIRRADKRQADLLVQAWLGEERPLRDLQYGRHVYHEGHQNWQDQKHLHNEIQEGTEGDEIWQF